VPAQVSKGDVIAFRLQAHHLSERLGRYGLLDAAGQCGIQNSPPGSALLALHARGRNVSQERVGDAVAEEKSLLQAWCMRGSPYYFPTADAPVFTTGVLPPTEEATRHFIPGAEQAVDRLGMSLTETVELAGAGGSYSLTPRAAGSPSRLSRPARRETCSSLEWDSP